MIGNIVDGRSSNEVPECDVVFEPSAHENAQRPDGSAYFGYDTATTDPGYFYAKAMNDTTVREALLRAESEWRFPVTVYLYDKGSRPLG